MNGKTDTPTMIKLKNRRGLWWGILLSAAALLLVLPKELLMDTLGRIQSRGLFRMIDTMWRFNRGPLYGLAIFTGLALLVLIALLRILSLTRRIAHEPENVPQNKPRPAVREVPTKGGASVKQSKQPMDKKSLIVTVGIVAVIMAYAVASDPDTIIPAVGTMVVMLVIAVAFAAAGKKKKPGASPDNAAPRAFRHADEAEEAITCAHHTGKEKYLEQVEGFYKNGLIDRAEYKALREKYEKMDIPEDYH